MSTEFTDKIRFRHEEEDKRRFFLLAIRHRWSGLEEGTDQGLDAASPAPGSGSEVLSHHRTVLMEESTESLTTNQSWSLREKETK